MSKRVTNYELKQLIETQGEKIDEVCEVIFGDGNPEKGLLMRVRDNETVVKEIRRLLRTAVSAAVVAVVGLLISLLS